jgi:hypothetical protein
MERQRRCIQKRVANTAALFLSIFDYLKYHCILQSGAILILRSIKHRIIVLGDNQASELFNDAVRASWNRKRIPISHWVKLFVFSRKVSDVDYSVTMLRAREKFLSLYPWPVGENAQWERERYFENGF